MRLSCCAYSYRKEIQSGEMTLLDFITLCREIGFEGAELTSYYFQTTERVYLNEVKRYCHKEGVLISGTAVGNNFAQVDAAARRQHIEMTQNWIDNSVILGAATLRVFAGYVKAGEDRVAAFQNVVAGMQECAEYAWERGVTLALENHDGLTQTAQDLSVLLNAINRPGIAVNLDTGNFIGEIYGDIANSAPFAVACHAKEKARGVEPNSKFDVDYHRVRRVLEDVNYRGFIAVEYEEEEPAPVAVPAFFKILKEAFGK